MMGQRNFETKLYYQLSLDQLVPQDHLLRRIAEAVDFSFVRPLCRPYYSHTGQPSVDPVVIFKMLLLGYLYGITSERRLAEEVRLHLGYRWFLGYDIDLPTPDHSVLSKARARFGNDVFEEFFRQSIELCRQAGLMEEGPVYVDSTLMRANASVDSLAPRAEVARPPLSVTEYLHRLDQDEATPPDEDPPASGPPSTGGPLLRPNQQLQSRTDPEATLVNRPDFGRHLAYKAHVAVAGRRGQVITAAVATTGTEADEHLLARRCSGTIVGSASTPFPLPWRMPSTGPRSTTSTWNTPVSPPSFRRRASATSTRASGDASTSSGCLTRTPSSVPPASVCGGSPT
jgi:transposase